MNPGFGHFSLLLIFHNHGKLAQIIRLIASSKFIRPHREFFPEINIIEEVNDMPGKIFGCMPDQEGAIAAFFQSSGALRGCDQGLAVRERFNRLYRQAGSEVSRIDDDAGALVGRANIFHNP